MKNNLVVLCFTFNDEMFYVSKPMSTEDARRIYCEIINDPFVDDLYSLSICEQNGKIIERKRWW